MPVTQLSDSLYLIPLDLPREGFHHFISTWIYLHDDAVVMVDPGPRITVPLLLQALHEITARPVSHILLTHIHLDHAGGLGTLVKQFPEAKVACHRKGIQHLVEPAKLWQASKKILGEIAECYGEPEPTPAANIDCPSRIQSGRLAVTVHETPGHASHHCCYQIGDLLFAGEALGVCYPVGNDIYLRTASPAGFDCADYGRSIALLGKLPIRTFCFGHYGASTEVNKIFGLASAQIKLWTAVISKYRMLESPRFEEQILNELLRLDPALAGFHQQPPDIQKREQYFLGNCLQGFKIALESE